MRATSGPSRWGDDESDEDGGKTQAWLPWLATKLEDRLGITLMETLERLAPYSAEFMGSCALALTFACAKLGNFSVTWGPTSLGLMLWMLSYSLGPVSGAHFNPAVSISVGLASPGRWGKLLTYVAVQFLGNIIGCYIACALYGHLPWKLGPRQDFSRGAPFLVEFIYTAMWCFVYLNVTVSRHNNPLRENNHFYGLAIGSAAIAGTSSAKDISGGILNPALSFAITLLHLNEGVGHFWGYLFAQLFGALAGALVFRVVRPAEGREASEMSEYVPGIVEMGLAEGAGAMITTFTLGIHFYSHAPCGPWALGTTQAAMVYAVADISGGYFNPMVTLAVLVAGRDQLEGRRCAIFMGVQMFFALLAAVMYASLHNFSAVPLWSPGLRRLGATLVAETIFSFALAFAVLAAVTLRGVRTRRARNDFFGLTVGMCVAAAGMASSSISAGVLNPAAAVAIASVHFLRGGRFFPCLMYSACEFVGGVLAAFTFRRTHSEMIEVEALSTSPVDNFPNPVLRKPYRRLRQRAESIA